jgi:hypothetical protein
VLKAKSSEMHMKFYCKFGSVNVGVACINFLISKCRYIRNKGEEFVNKMREKGMNDHS